jgi:hypothetical protein
MVVDNCRDRFSHLPEKIQIKRIANCRGRRPRRPETRKEISMNNIYIQLIGVVALIFWVISIQTKNKTKLLKLQNVANLFYAIQYAFLGAFSATGMNCISLLKGIVFLKSEKSQKQSSKIQLTIFSGLIIAIGIITFQTWYSIIPIIITLAYTYSTWQKNATIIRITFLVAAIGWIIFNTIVGAYSPLIGNFIEVVSGITAIVKFDILKKGEKECKKD